MTQFNPGDRVRHLSTQCRGTVLRRDALRIGGEVRVKWDDLETPLGAYAENLELLAAGRQLVGPKPKDEGPVFQTPFAYDGDDSVTDARGRIVLQLAFNNGDFPGTGDPEWDAWGEYVAAALNAKAEAS